VHAFVTQTTAAVLPDLGTAAAPLAGLLGGKHSVRVGGLFGAATGLAVASVAGSAPAVLVVVADAKAADAAVLDLAAFLGRTPLELPLWPHEPSDTPPDADTLAARVEVLTALAARRAGTVGEPPVVVAPLAALAQDVPSPAVFEAATLRVRTGEEHPPATLMEHLALSGFVRVGAVESPGEFAGRGGVVDVFPFGALRPVRLDFFGDAVESIRVLDPTNQRSGEALPEAAWVCLAPERVRDPATSGGACLLTEHLPPGSLVVLVEPAALSAKVALLRGEGGVPSRLRWRRFEDALRAARRLEVSALPLGPDGDLDVAASSVEDVRGIAAWSETVGRAGAPAGARRTKADPQAVVAAAFRRLAGRASRIVVFRRAQGEEERLRELLEGIEPRAPRGDGVPDLRVDGVPVEFRPGSLTASFVLGATRTAYLAYDDLADLSLRERRPSASLPAGRPIHDFLELEVGAHVVHLHHGIGVFRRLVTTDGPSGPSQSLEVEFAEGTRLFVPVARIDLLQRYVGTGRRPRLSKVGGTEWAGRKAKVEAAVEDVALELLETQARRHQRAGPPARPHPHWQDEFEKAFPWRDTPDQAAATAAIKADLAAERPMDRLLCGDVGYGKTEVALRAAFLVATAGRQVAVLVPTTVLAEQHVRVFAQRLAPYPLVVRALSRFRTPAETREILGGLADGSIDVVVGTHRLLSKDVTFRRLGLVVVDEEQRFGVVHKERLKALRGDVDVLTLSATPIPRTLHMALLGLRDIGNLTTPPPGRQPIETKVARVDDALVREAIRRELDRGGQVFFVHNRVYDLDLVAGTVMRLVPEARVAVVHGQMDRDLVEARMLGFVRGEVDVLVTTTIVESGLDIPNANTMVIHNADRFGLAELHQLRGRVGRERRHAHCLLLIAPDRALSEEAARRLRALEEYSELGAGFRIAMRDLELRGAGNLLGAAQSGHIASVGYDLYCRLLADAVRRVRRQGPRTAEPASVEVEVPAGIPDSYVSDPRETFRLFRRISTAPTAEVLEGLEEELLDRFGPLPEETERLFLHQRVRLAAGFHGIARVRAAEAGGLVLDAVAGGDAIDRLTLRGLALRRLDVDRAYLAPPPEDRRRGGAPDSAGAATLRTLRHLLARLSSGR
jgi:transcription-repair coupling factor (superfamily II helicase)